MGTLAGPPEKWSGGPESINASADLAEHAGAGTPCSQADLVAPGSTASAALKRSAICASPCVLLCLWPRMGTKPGATRHLGEPMPSSSSLRVALLLRIRLRRRRLRSGDRFAIGCAFLRPAAQLPQPAMPCGRDPASPAIPGAGTGLGTAGLCRAIMGRHDPGGRAPGSSFSISTGQYNSTGVALTSRCSSECTVNYEISRL
jgi:hypothetical protein